MSENYPKMGTLFRLEAGSGGKWWRATDALLPDTAGLFFIEDEHRVVTEKIDGSNMWLDCRTAIIGKRSGKCAPHDKGDAFYCEVGEPLFERIDRTRIEDVPFLLRFGAVTLFGELVGPKVQSSGRLYPEREFVLFDVRGEDGRYFRWEAVKAVAATLGLHHVPEMEGPKAWDFVTVREYVLGLQSALDPAVQAEGIVVRDSQDTSPVRRRIAKIRRKDFRS